MIKVSKLADYAVVILAAMGKMPQQQVTTASVSLQTKLPEPTVAKVLKMLSKAGLVNSTRGPAGGYTLAKAPGETSVAEIIIAVDGPISLTACVEGHNAAGCDYETCCPVKGRWNQVNGAIYETLGRVTLADMMQDKKDVKAA